MKHYLTPDMMLLKVMSEDVLSTSGFEEGNADDLAKEHFSIFGI